VALLLLVVAVWVGLNFATQIVRPIGGLVTAAERVRGGDLSARVPEAGANDEFASLSRAFNRMTNQLESQQRELVEANRQLDFRRRFTETVLAGVSAGVIGLDDFGHINLPNRSASVLLGTDLDLLIGHPLAEAVPEMAPLLEEAMRRPDRLAQGQIRIFTRGRPSTLLVRITVEADKRETRGFVVTFDDITELLSAQRKAAWADVARRIAHEMKNPLTPIQLSAERLKRKYLSQIQTDRETFEICTDTIIRQVGDIGRMVDEFSSFARMPTPVMRQENLLEITRQAVFLQRTAHSDITFEADLPTEPVIMACDGRLISQALINLLQNAVDAIHARQVAAESAPAAGWIRVRLYTRGGRTALDVEDNGKGLPKDSRETLTEPYVTTRTKGTGLGLAIVKKIMEDHAGELLLDDLESGGARVSLIFPPGAGGAAAIGPTSAQESARSRTAIEERAALEETAEETAVHGA
jgi:two-component system nitrogen regulation sensor histidine kinase NtrY